MLFTKCHSAYSSIRCLPAASSLKLPKKCPSSLNHRTNLAKSTITIVDTPNNSLINLSKNSEQCYSLRKFRLFSTSATQDASASDSAVSSDSDSDPQTTSSENQLLQSKSESLPFIPVLQPDSTQLRTVWLTSAVPMVGFGFMDNIVMIQAGDLIDNTIGVHLGLATLTAAAFGQVFSDVSGVMFGGVVDAICLKMGLPVSDLTNEQRQLGIVKRTSTFGAVCGVICGCLLGMTSLLFMDLEAADRAKREKELDTIFRTVILEGNDTLQAERSTLFLVDKEKRECWSRTGVGLKESQQIRVSMDNSLVGACATSGEIVSVVDAYKDTRFSDEFDKRTGFKTKSILCVPVLRQGLVIEEDIQDGLPKQIVNTKFSNSSSNSNSNSNESSSPADTSKSQSKSEEHQVLAVVQLVNKRGGGAWSDQDERTAKMLARHVGIFLESVDEGND